MSFLGKTPKMESVILTHESIMEKWAILILNTENAAERIFKATEEQLNSFGLPGVEIRKIGAVSGRKKSSLGGADFSNPREYLMVRSSDFQDFIMLIGARPFGKYLNVHWYLTCMPRMSKRIASNILSARAKQGQRPDGQALSFDLSTFEQQDLTAFTSLAHNAFMESLGEVMKDTGENPAKLGNRRSEGFLRIV